jgi:acyl-CoA thioesterase II
MTSTVVAALTLDPVGPDHYRVTDHVGPAGGVIFGGQLLAQSIVAARAGHDDKQVKSVHTVFARAASTDAPIEIAVDPTHSGRTFASSTVTISQGERMCARSLVLLSADEADFIRHADPVTSLTDPGKAMRVNHGDDGWDIRIVGDVDVSDPDLVGPPDLDVWTRFPDAPSDPASGQALLAYASDGFLIGTAMRPHAGVGQAQAHVTISTGVVSHTLTFHEPFSARDWLLLSHHSTYAGRGRAHGRANVFDRDGTLVASFVQDGMIRPTNPGSAGSKL